MAMLVKKLIDEHVLEARSKVFQKGSLLFAAGDHPTQLYYLVQGQVCLLGKSGSLLKNVKPGAVLGLADIMNEKHQCTAVVVEASQVQIIEREKILQLIEHNPALRLYFLRLLSMGLAAAQPVYE